MTPCPNCIKAATYPQYRWFNPACLHCGARIIQHLGTLGLSPDSCATRRRANLADWMAMGHNEAQIRSLAKGPLAITPPPEPLGLATPAASVPQAKAKRH
jgi:hypothetical protein